MRWLEDTGVLAACSPTPDRSGSKHPYVWADLYGTRPSRIRLKGAKAGHFGLPEQPAFCVLSSILRRDFSIHARLCRGGRRPYLGATNHFLNPSQGGQTCSPLDDGCGPHHRHPRRCPSHM